MKKIVCSAVLLTSFFGQDAQAFNVKFSEVRDTSNRAVAPSRPVPLESTTMTPLSSAITKCEAGDAFPLSILNAITENNEDIRIIGFDKEDKDKRIRVQIPPYMTACSDLKDVKFQQNKKSNNVFVRLYNKFDYDAWCDGKIDKEGRAGTGVSAACPAEFKKWPMMQKYEYCLQQEGIMKTDGTVNIDVTKDIGGGSKTEFKLKHFDPEKPMSIYYGSPLRPGGSDLASQALHNINDDDVIEDGSCYNIEDIDSNGGIVYSDKDASEASLYNICENGSAAQIEEQIRKLRENDTGNSDELIKILQEALEIENDRYAKEEIFARLREIEQEFAPSDDDDELDGESYGVGEEEARELADEYLDLVKQFDQRVMKPSIGRLAQLLKERKATKDKKRKKEIDEEIKKLNDRIGKLGEKQLEDIEEFFDGMREYAITDVAEDIHGYIKKSRAYGRVYKEKYKRGRGSRLSLKGAARQVEQDIKRYRNNYTSHWDDVYAVKHRGSRRPIDAAFRRANSFRMKASEVEKRYAKDFKQYCGRKFFYRATAQNPYGLKNPQLCQSWQSSTLEVFNRTLHMPISI